MNDYPKKKKFLELPQYGDKQQLLDFIKKNLVYPKQALENKIEGDVFIEYTVNFKGIVSDAWVNKGIGHGCDEEAIRVVKLLRYQETKNRGVRVSTNHKLKVHFRLPKPEGISKEIKVEYKENPKKAASPEQSQKIVYSYTINLDNQ